MTAADRKLIAKEVAKEILRQTDKVLNECDLMRLLQIKTVNALRHKKKLGFPIRRKNGIGYFAFESEILNHLRSN